jgi:hypothetical protein
MILAAIMVILVFHMRLLKNKFPAKNFKNNMYKL